MTCSLCRIMKTSFDIRMAKDRSTKFQRFGHGIYTSATSSKSDHYSKNVRVESSNKAVLVAKVAVGRAKKLVINDTRLVSAPPGYDSVIGEPIKDGELNYDELVVYSDDAIIPSYLVIYGY